jgi:proteasome-associated ATPase
MRGTGISSDVNNTIVPTFLSEMDGFEDNSPFIILATNIPHILDPAIIREGRIDLKLEITRPTMDDAKEIASIHFKKLKCKSTVKDLSDTLITQVFNHSILMHQISGAMLENLTKISAQYAIKRYLANTDSPKGIIEEDIINAIDLSTKNYHETESSNAR